MMEGPWGDTNRFRWRYILWIATLTVLLVEIPPGVFWLGPILVLALRENGKSALLALVLAWLFIGMGIWAGWGDGGATSILCLVLLSLVGLVFCRLFLGGYSISLAGLTAVATGVMMVAILIGIAMQQADWDLDGTWKTSVEIYLDEFTSQVGVLADQDGEQFQELEPFLVFVRAKYIWFLYLMPGVAGLVLALSIGVNLWAAKVFAPDSSELKTLVEWRPPEEWFWGLIAGAAMVLSQFTPLMVVGLNCLLVGAAIYLVSGVTISASVAQRWKLPAWAFFLLLALFTVSGGLPYFALLGVVDFWLDFRARWRRADGQR